MEKFQRRKSPWRNYMEKGENFHLERKSFMEKISMEKDENINSNYL